jgi:hypothetical protein
LLRGTLRVAGCGLGDLQLLLFELIQELGLVLQFFQRNSQVVDVIGLMLEHVLFDNLFDLLLRLFLFPLFVVHFVDYELINFRLEPR